MKNSFVKYIFYCVTLLVLSSCHKSFEEITIPDQPGSAFDHYFIPKGQHYSQQSIYTPVEYNELRFTVKFDSSAVYTTLDPNNQYDINKLYGFSDNGTVHHEFSARIGWRWSDNALRLFGYVYNNGEVSYEELTTISTGTEHECSIRIEGNHYIFSADDKTLSMTRTGTAAVATGYKLFPYFGGDETAPHDIHIWIKEN